MARSVRALSSGGGTSGTMPIADEGYAVSGLGDTVLLDKTKTAEVIAAMRADKPIPAGLLNTVA